jgi:phospholipid methyltransferase
MPQLRPIDSRSSGANVRRIVSRGAPLACSTDEIERRRARNETDDVHPLDPCAKPHVCCSPQRLRALLDMQNPVNVRENTFTSATIEVAENQTVISTGPYAIVRHPMYAGGLLYLVGTPLALGSYWGFVPLTAMAPFLLWRLFDEERFLARNLPGYAEYQKRVRRRLVPFVW